MGTVIFIIFLGIAFITFRILSNPRSRLVHSYHLIHYVEIEHVEILPCFRIPFGKKHLHIHHWIYLTLVLAGSLLLNKDLFGELSAVNGFCAGGIIQGLTYSDRFKLRD